MTVTTELEARIEELRESPVYETYLDVRRRVLAYLDGATDADVPSTYWQEELAGFEYLLDASPLLIDQLRQHSYHVTGIRHYDYRSGKHKTEERMRAKLDQLLAIGGEELFVPEPRVLGGFGFPYGDGLYNVDTLKFYEAMIALDRAAVLEPLRRGDERSVVWEIGAGWGGMAATVKTTCPRTTYVIVDLPQLFLFSAVYLRAVFPQARFGWAGDGDLGELVASEEYDFVFVPHTDLEALTLRRLDLVINMVSFQEMTTAQVEAYVEHAWALGAPYLYSLNRDRSLYNDELSNVAEIVGRRFRPHEIPVLDVPYTQLASASGKAKKAPKPGKADKLAKAVKPGRKAKEKTKVKSPKGEDGLRLDYRHVVGWRRDA